MHTDVPELCLLQFVEHVHVAIGGGVVDGRLAVHVDEADGASFVPPLVEGHVVQAVREPSLGRHRQRGLSVLVLVVPLGAALEQFADYYPQAVARGFDEGRLPIRVLPVRVRCTLDVLGALLEGPPCNLGDEDQLQLYRGSSTRYARYTWLA